MWSVESPAGGARAAPKTAPGGPLLQGSLTRPGVTVTHSEAKDRGPEEGFSFIYLFLYLIFEL